MTFIFLINFTDEGIKGIKGSAGRREELNAMISGLGGSVVAGYLTMGAYDRVLIADFPDGDAAAKFALSWGAKGYTRSTTLRAFNQEEATKLIADAP